MDDRKRPLDCKSCGATLGECSALELRIGDVAIVKRVEMRCLKCNSSRVWYPTKSAFPQPSAGMHVRP